MSTNRAEQGASTNDAALSAEEAARLAGVTPATLRRWARQGLIPRHDGSWSKLDDRARDEHLAAGRASLDQGGPHLVFERIGEVRLKGFTESTEIFLARQREEQ
jgi:MerR family regulatory protein